MATAATVLNVVVVVLVVVLVLQGVNRVGQNE